MFAIKACKAWKTKAQSVSSMTSSNNLTDQYLDMNDLCDDSLQALITHYTGLKYKLTDNIRVRERLTELQDEQIKRERKASTIEGVIRQNTDNPLQNQ